MTEAAPQTCSACGAGSPAGKRFCGECGAPFASMCGACGAALEPGKRFCGDCGAPVAAGESGAVAAAVVVAAAAPVAERRVCSVLFVDLVGFTPMSESRDPEAVRELLSQYFDLARTVIGRYGGTVEKFIGDAVMAVWGAPVAAEGDAERAVRAALDVVESVAELGREVGVDGLAARGGVVTGEVAVTIGAVGEGMVAGDAVNTAARVQSIASPGTVFVDESTWQVARGVVAFSPGGDHALKGKAESASLWRAERVISASGGAQRIDGLEAPMVGREAELRLVKEMFHAAVDRRSARLVSVTGPAGVGKSRLGWEFEKYVDGLASFVAWHRGRCLSYGDGVAFWALAEMVRQRFSIAEEDSADVVRTKLDVGLPPIVADAATRAYVRPRLARLLGLPSEDDGAGVTSRDELFAGWRVFVEQLAADRPVVMVVEDLQHADSGLLDFLDHLLDWARDSPIFVLTLARPEIEDRRAGWGAGRRNGTTLALDGLDDAAMAAMIDGLVADMPPEASRAVAEQAQGIPLYAMETVRMLIDRDVVQPVDGVYRLVGDIGELSVPHTLQSLLAARLDALDGTPRRLVGDAAVLGGTFPVEALVEVSGLPADEVRRAVSDLVRREVLAVRADPLSPERGQYAFVQTMFRQVAYDTMSRRERKSRHLKVADHLGLAFAASGEEVSEVVAQHLLDALAAVPDDADVEELRRRACAALVVAAERAERMGATIAAGRSYRKAAELEQLVGEPLQDERAAGLLERAGSMFEAAGDQDVAAAVFTAADQLYLALGQPEAAARARVGTARAHRLRGRLDEARALVQDALTVLDDAANADAVDAIAVLAMVESALGMDVAAGSQRAFDLAQALGLGPSTLALLFHAAGLGQVLSNRLVQAAASFREVVRHAEAANDSQRATHGWLNLADVLTPSDPAAAAEAAAQSLVHARRSGNRGGASIGSGNLMQALFLLGRWAEVRGAAEAAAADGLEGTPYVDSEVMLFQYLSEGSPCEPPPSVEQLASSEDSQDRAIVHFCRAVALLSRAEHRESLGELWQVLEIAELNGIASEHTQMSFSFACGAAWRLRDDSQLQQLLDWVEGHPVGHLHRATRAERDRVRALMAAVRGEPAAELFDVAEAAQRDTGSPYHLAVGLLEHAEHCTDTGDDDRARELVAEVREIAGRLGCMPFQERAAALLSPVSA